MPAIAEGQAGPSKEPQGTGETRRNFLCALSGAVATAAVIGVYQILNPRINPEVWQMQLVGERERLRDRLEGFIEIRRRGEFPVTSMMQMQRQWGALCAEVETFNRSLKNYNFSRRIHYGRGSYLSYNSTFGPSPEVIVSPGELEEINLQAAQREWNAPIVTDEMGRVLPRTTNTVPHVPPSKKR